MNSNEQKWPSVAQIIAEIKSGGDFPKIRRQVITAYSVDECMEIVKAIGESFDSRFTIDENNRFVYENCVRWAIGDVGMRATHPETGAEIAGDLRKGIYIAGTVGSGKSLCMRILKTFCVKLKVRVAVGKEKVSSLLWWPSFRADELAERYGKEGDISEIKSCPVIDIQDLGSEPLETVYMGTRLEVLRGILEFRGDHPGEYLTLLTSNLKMAGDDLKELYGNRVSSRLREMCNYFEIKGKDRRKL